MGLIEDAKAAKEAGLSYGQYMLQKDFIPFKKPKGKRCEICGAPLIGKKLRFCSQECKYERDRRNYRGDYFV